MDLADVCVQHVDAWKYILYVCVFLEPVHPAMRLRLSEGKMW